MKKTIIMILIVGLILFGCVNPQPQNGTTNLTNNSHVVLIPNNNSNHTELEMGDTATVMYTLRIDDKVFDTNNATLGNISNLTKPASSYSPLVYKMDLNGSIIKGFVLNTLGMKVNETKRFLVEPKLGYGVWDPKNIITTGRYYNKSLEEVVPRSYFIQQGITNLTNGTSFNTPIGTVFIQDSNNENVTLFYVLLAGQKFETNGIPQKVVSLNNLTAKIEFDLNVNQTYRVPNPRNGNIEALKVINKTNDTITLDANPELAGKTLDFDVKVLKIN